jgi:hypothetical protein
MLIMNAKQSISAVVSSPLSWAIFAGLTLLFTNQEAQAQIRYTPPAGPTMPIELNYFRRDVGLLDQYNTFVRPQRELEAQLRQMTQQQRDDYRSTQRELEQIRQIRSSEAGVTGVRGGYFNYSHYYRMPTGRTGSARLR